MQTLEHEGFLLRLPGDERVLLGPQLLQLVRNADSQAVVQEVARPIVTEVVETIGETVTLSLVGTDGGLDLVEQIDAQNQLGPRSWIGQRFPLHCSASGKVLLATWDDQRLERFLAEPLEQFTPATITSADALRHEVLAVREHRYAVASDEEEEGLTGVGAGIYAKPGELLAVITASAPTQRMDLLRGREAIQQLLKAARTIEAALRQGR